MATYAFTHIHMYVCMEVVGNTWFARLAQKLFIFYTLFLFGHMLSKIAVIILQSSTATAITTHTHNEKLHAETHGFHKQEHFTSYFFLFISCCEICKIIKRTHGF